MTWAMDWETKNLRFDLEQLIASIGGGGTGGGFYRHVQASASVTWVIAHGLPFRPNVAVVDSTGRIIIPEVDYLSNTQVVCSFSSAVAGEAYLS